MFFSEPSPMPSKKGEKSRGGGEGVGETNIFGGHLDYRKTRWFRPDLNLGFPYPMQVSWTHRLIIILRRSSRWCGAKNIFQLLLMKVACFYSSYFRNEKTILSKNSLPRVMIWSPLPLMLWCRIKKGAARCSYRLLPLSSCSHSFPGALPRKSSDSCCPPHAIWMVLEPLSEKLTMQLPYAPVLTSMGRYQSS